MAMFIGDTGDLHLDQSTLTAYSGQTCHVHFLCLHSTLPEIGVLHESPTMYWILGCYCFLPISHVLKYCGILL